MSLNVMKQDTLSSERVKSDVLARAAYQAAERLVDWSTGSIHDYRTRPCAIAHKELLAPEHVHAAAEDRESLWNKVARHARRGAWPAYRFALGVPALLSLGDQVALVRDFARAHIVELGQAADFALDVRDPSRPVARLLTSCRSLPGAPRAQALRLDAATFRCWQEDWGRRCASARYRVLIKHEAQRRSRTLRDAS